MDLLDQFVTWECTPNVRELLRAALRTAKLGTGPSIRRFEFNRFNVTVDCENDVVVLEDVLSPADSGVQQLPLSEFIAALSS